jgi:hypothetical protein
MGSNLLSVSFFTCFCESTDYELLLEVSLWSFLFLVCEKESLKNTAIGSREQLVNFKDFHFRFPGDAPY